MGSESRVSGVKGQGTRRKLTLNSMLWPAKAPKTRRGLVSWTSKVSQLKRTLADSQKGPQSLDSGKGLTRSLYQVISLVSSSRNLMLRESTNFVRVL